MEKGDYVNERFCYEVYSRLHWVLSWMRMCCVRFSGRCFCGGFNAEVIFTLILADPLK